MFRECFGETTSQRWDKITFCYEMRVYNCSRASENLYETMMRNIDENEGRTFFWKNINRKTKIFQIIKWKNYYKLVLGKNKVLWTNLLLLKNVQLQIFGWRAGISITLSKDIRLCKLLVRTNKLLPKMMIQYETFRVFLSLSDELEVKKTINDIIILNGVELFPVFFLIN